MIFISIQALLVDTGHGKWVVVEWRGSKGVWIGRFGPISPRRPWRYLWHVGCCGGGCGSSLRACGTRRYLRCRHGFDAVG